MQAQNKYALIVFSKLYYKTIYTKCEIIKFTSSVEENGSNHITWIS